MNKIVFNAKHKKILNSILLTIPNVRAGKMFGYPAYFIGKRMFACVYEDGIGVKLPADLVTSLIDGDTYIPFQPLGRPKMREWVQICRKDPSGYRSDMGLFIASAEFVNKKPISLTRR